MKRRFRWLSQRDYKHDPWYQVAYWAIYRLLYHKIHSPRYWYCKAKFFIQRGRRGWADCDTWALEEYLSGWMPDALRYLKVHTRGVPTTMFVDDPIPAHEADDPKGTIYAAAHERWGETLDKMITAFDAYLRFTEGLYEKELGPQPLGFYTGPHLSKGAYKKMRHAHLRACEELEERDRQIFKEGMGLFVEHFESLWTAFGSSEKGTDS